MTLLDLPGALLGALACGAWVLTGVAGQSAFHRLCPVEFGERERNLAIALLAVVATVNSLLLAFSAVSVWDAYRAADQAVQGEAVTVGVLARDLAVFDTADARHARDLLAAYTQKVLDKEWSAMKHHRLDDDAWAAFDQLFRAVGRLEPADGRQQALMTEIWARTDELIQYRRARLAAGSARMPLPLWIVVVAGTLLTIAVAYVFSPTAFNVAAVALLSLSLGLVFFFIVAMDRPFAGVGGIGPDPIASELSRMARWSTEDASDSPCRRATTVD